LMRRHRVQTRSERRWESPRAPTLHTVCTIPGHTCLADTAQTFCLYFQKWQPGGTNVAIGVNNEFTS
jgi:hypothetical protein